ncbi:DUF4124 domain-containing protein [Aquincola sp. S2]|uniref:DUF4124 domain-containing protein n=1 Tax=Pseudaquabacterium terrae TaxID=2732868 RepID=A0ABX2ERQ4_9BURK|nr:DUF4124 domain-containing protein [Aquabacterium terrae]NRF71417.1 DUF4124 domain-containing protein [Aquabacterium terrae]
MHETLRWTFATATSLVMAAAIAQPTGLRHSNGNVYRCDVDGKVTYSDEPCLGAKRVDVQPTRGLDKSSGKERTGADVARERRREGLAEALRPVTGMDAKQFDAEGRRHRLQPADKAECRWLDASIARLEASEKAATGEATATQRDLLSQRRRYLDLRC